MYTIAIFIEGFPNAFSCSNGDEGIAKAQYENVKAGQKDYMKSGEDCLISLEGDDKGLIHFLASRIVAVCLVFSAPNLQVLQRGNA